MNPALELYDHWLNAIKYQGKKHLRAWEAYVKDLYNSGTLLDDIEDELPVLTQQPLHAMLNYRLGVRIVGMSRRHLAGSMFASVEDFSPVIKLIVRGRCSYAYDIMTLYPNGVFQMHQTPFSAGQIYSDWTFLSSGWGAGRRQWTVDDAPWVSLKEKDFNNRIPYLDNHAFVETGYYQLLENAQGQWYVSDILDQPDFDEIRMSISVKAEQYKAADKIRDGYAAADRRYEYWRRKHLRDVGIKPNDNVLRIDGQRTVGDQAVKKFSEHMQVYGPAPSPKEATDVSNISNTKSQDDMVAGSIPVQAGVAPH